MSFLTQGIQAASKVVTEQPTLNNLETSAGGWIPAIERAIQRIGQVNHGDITLREATQPSAPIDDPAVTVLDAPPSYHTIFPEEYDSNIAKLFQSNEWQEIAVNDKRIFQDLDKDKYKRLDESISDIDVSPYMIKVVRETADDVKCKDFDEFIRILEFVKQYFKLQKEKQLAAGKQNSANMNNGLQTAPIDIAQTVNTQQHYHGNTNPVVDPICCFFCFDGLPPTHGGGGCPCCFCCLPFSHQTTADTVDTSHAANDDCCNCECDDCGECDCGDADCGDCDCGDCF